MGSAEQEIVRLTGELLQAVALSDYETYVRLNDESLSCFEPEAKGHLVEGLGFHKFYFGAKKTTPSTFNTMTSTKVRMLGSDAAVITYIRLTQSGDVVKAAEETRIWQPGVIGVSLATIDIAAALNKNERAAV